MMQQNNSPVTHAPHRPLLNYYGAESDRTRWVSTLFDETAADYERVTRLMDFGSGARYRHVALRRAGLQHGMSVVDVGTGTGLVAREAAQITGSGHLVTGVDPSSGMLSQAIVPEGVVLLQGSAEQLPLADACADFLCMGYALRHVSDLMGAFEEFRRVLKPGGRLCILEITAPAGRIRNFLLRTYMRGVVPALSRLVASAPSTPQLMRYYWDTIEACVPPEQVLGTLRHAGFGDVRRYVQGGVLSEYQAVNS
jgi:demethylmenaquinone methyltransferase / 2-methoxy-6-polyprenyl-1,4-benzoquinol methylase